MAKATERLVWTIAGEHDDLALAVGGLRQHVDEEKREIAVRLLGVMDDLLCNTGYHLRQDAGFLKVDIEEPSDLFRVSEL